jgi:hypothetical protein
MNADVGCLGTIDMEGEVAREVPRPAGKSAGLRDDAAPKM